jgi:hypothetical protein
MNSPEPPHRCHRLDCSRCDKRFQRPTPRRRRGVPQAAIALIQLVSALFGFFREP